MHLEYSDGLVKWITQKYMIIPCQYSLSLSLSLSLSFAGRLISFVRFLKNLLCEKQGVKDTKVI